MSTAQSNNASSGELPDRQASSAKSGNLHIQMLERGGDDLSNDGSKWLNALYVCFTFFVLYLNMLNIFASKKYKKI